MSQKMSTISTKTYRTKLSLSQINSLSQFLFESDIGLGTMLDETRRERLK